MATTESSDQYTLEVANTKLAVGSKDSPLMILSDSVTLASEAATSTITFATLPLGVKIKWVLVSFGALGTSSTIQVGVTGTTGLFYGASDSSAAGALTDCLVAGVDYETLAATKNVIITTSAHVTTGTIKILVAYTM